MPSLHLVARRLGTPAILLASLALAACTPMSQYRDLLAEKERLARENDELRRTVAEQKVRVEEAMEALHRQGLGSAGAAPVQQVPSSVDTASAGVETIEPGFAPEAARIQDEDIREAPPIGVPAASNSDAVLRVARSYAAQGKTRQAIDAYTRLIQDDPFSSLLPEAFLERGKLKLGLGDRDGALADFDTVVEAYPRSPLAAEARRQGDSLRRR
jgi:tetratricopeptide (TPR) repeat protein